MTDAEVAKAPIMTQCHAQLEWSFHELVPGIGAHTNPSIMMTPALLSFGHLLKLLQRR